MTMTRQRKEEVGLMIAAAIFAAGAVACLTTLLWRFGVHIIEGRDPGLLTTLFLAGGFVLLLFLAVLCALAASMYGNEPRCEEARHKTRNPYVD